MRSPAATAAPTDLAAVVRAHQAAVWRHLRLLGADGATASELAQAAFVQWWQRRPEDLGPAALRGWLRTTARHLFFAELRAQRRRGAVERLDAEAVERAWVAVERDDDGLGHREALRACLASLPARERELLAAAVVDEVPFAELAPPRGLGVEAVRSLVRRLKTALRDCVRRRLA